MSSSLYCLNNPLKYIDPAGERPLHWPEEDWWGKNYGNTEEGQEGEVESTTTRRKTASTHGTPIWERPPLESRGFEGTLSNVLGIGGGGGFGVVVGDGNIRFYRIMEASGGLDVSGSLTYFSSDLTPEEVANSECEEISGSVLFANCQVSTDDSWRDMKKSNIGLSRGLPASGRKSHVMTSEIHPWEVIKGGYRWLKDQLS